MSYAMTEEHKDALAEGRRMGRVVRAYLESLNKGRPRRGRKAATDTMEGIEKRLAAIEEELAEANSLQRLALVQERLDLNAKWDLLVQEGNDEALEEEFVEVAADYAHRKGISYQAFREMGVPADVLKRAGLSRASH